MSRKQVLDAIRAAGARGDQLALVRLYTENRIAYMAALTAYAQGAKLARGVA